MYGPLGQDASWWATSAPPCPRASIWAIGVFIPAWRYPCVDSAVRPAIEACVIAHENVTAPAIPRMGSDTIRSHNKRIRSRGCMRANLAQAKMAGLHDSMLQHVT
jgi:hypothetical protein